MLYCLYSTTYNESQHIYIFHCIFKWYVNLWANMCMSVGVCCANSDTWPESWDQEGLGQGFPLVYFNIGLRYPEVRETWEWGLLRNTWLHKSLSGRLPLCQNFRPDRNFNHYDPTNHANKARVQPQFLHLMGTTGAVNIHRVCGVHDWSSQKTLTTKLVLY